MMGKQHCGMCQLQSRNADAQCMSSHPAVVQHQTTQCSASHVFLYNVHSTLQVYAPLLLQCDLQLSEDA